jgi:formylglycine-generating enzyme required for sulfatase activity
MAAALAMAALASCDDGLTAGEVEPLALPASPLFTPVQPLTAGTATAPGAVVGNFAEGLAYSLVDGTAYMTEGAAIRIDRDNGKFVVDGTELKVGETALTSGAYYIFIQAGKGGATFSVTGSFYVAEGGGPTDFGFEQGELFWTEDSTRAGAKAGEFGSPVGGKAPYVYMLVAGNSENDEHNNFFEIQDGSLIIKSEITEAGEYSIHAKIIDSEIKVFEKSFTIEVKIFSAINAKNIEQQMVLVTGKTVTGSNDYAIAQKTDESSKFTVFFNGRTVEIPSFMMSKYEIAYIQWYDVRVWAEQNGYIFVEDRKGAPRLASPDNASGINPYEHTHTKNVPVGNKIGWRDVVVWCNALSEYTGRKPVYYIDSNSSNTFDEGDSWLRVSNTTASSKNTVQEIDKVKMDKTKNGYRLPTEVEWEFAARGGDPEAADWMYRWAGTDDPDEVAEYGYTTGSGGPSSMRVGSRLPNRLGLYDMSGNVSEFCWDLARSATDIKDSSKVTLTIDGPTAQASTAYTFFRVQRGVYNSDLNLIRVSTRSGTAIGSQTVTSGCGFRIVRNAG